MIIKELEVQTHVDPLRRAGYEAERQMAHYLKRAYGEDPYKFVLNNLRVERGGEVAQVDHLIVLRFGLLVVESKSVAGQLSVNEQGEWTRWWNRQGRGMPSPVLQARRQLDLLCALLNDHTAELLDRGLFGLKQRTFTPMRRDVLVAVSDGGRITRNTEVPEVVKADQVPDRVQQGIREMQGRLTAFTFSDAEMTRICAFLRNQHVAGSEAQPDIASVSEPLHVQPPSSVSRPSAPRGLTGVVSPPHSLPVAAPALLEPAQTEPAQIPNCRQCQSSRLSMQYGKYGYYFKCATCDANTPAKPVCPTCAEPARLSKSGAQFTAACAGGHQWRYWTNGSSPHP
ncbi:NERD domain-containing protein [Deinococcus saxicola]|uniref:nuclease-related domain-containing protein n=1 Tax=Deinococcus saxicola TaxID=249406 RepID=UPI0039EFBD40